MKLAFFHYGEKIKRDVNGNYYTDGSYNDEVWKSYLSLFSDVTLVMRFDSTIYSTEEAKKRFNLIPSFFTVLELPNRHTSVKAFLDCRIKTRTTQIIEQAVAHADAVIVRFQGTNQAVDFANKYGKPCLVEVVGCPFDALWNYSFKGKVLAVPQYFRMRAAVKKAPNVIYVTERFLQNRYPTNGRYIGCSDVKLSGFDPSKIKKDYNNSGRFVIGTAAAVDVKYKGQQYVIKAIGKLKRMGVDNIEYQIAGHGNARYLQEVAKRYNVTEQVRFMGSIPHAQISEWYKSLDLYIQSSNLEGLPRALVEAMSCALPCIGSNVGGIPELLDDVVMFKKRNVDDLVAAIKRMLDFDFRKKQAQRNYQKSMEYDVAKLEAKRVEFMKSVFCGKSL